ncbi:unnamed protein product [Rhizopus stolonifer]
MNIYIYLFISTLHAYFSSIFFPSLDCHMMVSNPSQWVDDIANAGGEMYTFHIEATKDPLALIDQIHAAGMKAGVAVKPKTPVEEVLGAVAEKCDMILIMTVEPGFGGQRFMKECMPKVETLRRKYPLLDIEVDGGLSLETIDASADAGANVIVAGTGIFGAEKPDEVITTFKEKVNKAQSRFAKEAGIA